MPLLLVLAPSFRLMKNILTLALALTTSAALAQTVLPSGAVAPSSGTLTPGTVPGAQTVTTPDMRNGGSPRTPRRDETAPGMTHHDKKQLRKMSKVNSESEDKVKTGKQ